MGHYLSKNKRDLFFPPYGLLARPAQITNTPFRLYNPENLCAFQIMFSGHLRGIKVTSPPIFTIL